MSIPHQTAAPSATPPGCGGYPPAPGGYGYGGYPPAGGHGYGPPPSNGMAIASLVLGIVSLLGGIIPILGWFAAPFALAAVGFAFAGLSRAKTVERGRGLAIGGLVTGIMAILAITVWTVLIVGQVNHTADLVSGEAFFGCDVTRDDYEESVEQFRAAEGREPTSDDEMVAEGHLGWTSGDFDVEIIDGRAEVVEEPGGSC